MCSRVVTSWLARAEWKGNKVWLASKKGGIVVVRGKGKKGYVNVDRSLLTVDLLLLIQ